MNSDAHASHDVGTMRLTAGKVVRTATATSPILHSTAT